MVLHYCSDSKDKSPIIPSATDHFWKLPGTVKPVKSNVIEFISS